MSTKNTMTALSRLHVQEAPREPFGGKYFGIWNVEGDEGEPIVLFGSRDDAEHELSRRQSLPDEDDDHMTQYHQVFPCDIAGCWWNSCEPDPREREPLTLEEIVSAQEGDL